MKALSIILPIYNVEKYLAKCLDSIYSQNLDESIFEVIAVIDGSPDNCIDIANTYAQTHKNLIVINKENGGVSSARNKGIEVAEGKNVMFVDPDDTLFPDSLGKIIDVLNEKNDDIVVVRSFYDNSEVEIFGWRHRIPSGTTVSGIEAYNKGYTRGGVWGVVYNKEFLCRNKLEFELHIKNSEDAIFFMKCQIKAETFHFADIKTYSLFTRSGSASQDMRKERISLWFNALEHIKELKHTEFKTTLEISIADGLIYAIISDITKNSIKTMGWNARRFLMEHNITKYLPICKENVKRSTSIHKFMKMAINASYNLFFCISFFRVKI